MRFLLILLCAAQLLVGDVYAGSHPRSSHRGSPRAHTTHHRDSAYRTQRNVPTSVKKELFKRAGIPWSQRHNYVVDHIIALENGGTNDISNLQIQTKEAAKAKDKQENAEAAARRHAEHPKKHYSSHRHKR